MVEELQGDHWLKKRNYCSNTWCLTLPGAIHAIARKVAAMSWLTGCNPNRPSQQSRRERGLPTEDRDRESERSARRRDPWLDRGRDRERKYVRENRKRRPAR